MTSAALPVVDVLGFPVCAASRTEILEWLWQRLLNRHSTHVITLNPEMVLLDRQTDTVEAAASRPPNGGKLPPPRLRELQGGSLTNYVELHSADLYVADGVGIVWAAKKLVGKAIDRYPGVDLAHDLMQKVAAVNGSVFLLGGAPGVAAAAAVNLTAALAGLRIAGTRDGFFSSEGDGDVAGQIAQSEADLLLVGMGCPRQEGFITMQRETLGVPVMIGVGGALDVFAGHKRRAPQLVQKLGLEWAWRGLSEPSRLKRQLALPRFAALVLREAKHHAVGTQLAASLQENGSHD
jgi:N-acetylglucosaminyldiphosphoundecaprenol N-acetyl-beta-D-mannosaminyltransferase